MKSYYIKLVYASLVSCLIAFSFVLLLEAVLISSGN